MALDTVPENTSDEFIINVIISFKYGDHKRSIKVLLQIYYRAITCKQATEKYFF